MISQISHGAATGIPLIIVHGLYGSARNWGVIAKRLSASRPVIAVDLRNHGQSPHLPTHSYPDLAADLAEIIAPHGQADVMGHSMGGKAAMMLALSQPDLVRRLIVADIAPVAYSHSQLPFIHAMRAVDLAAVSKRSDAASQLAALGVEPALQAFFTQSLDLQQRRWMLNLDVLEAEMPRIMSFPETPAGPFTAPTLFLSGGASDYVLPDHRPAIRARFPKARMVRIPGAGHWLHAEKPRAFVAAVDQWLTATQPA